MGNEISSLLSTEEKPNSTRQRQVKRPRLSRLPRLSVVPAAISASKSNLTPQTQTENIMTSSSKGLVYGCPICDEPLEVPAPNYEGGSNGGSNGPVVEVATPAPAQPAPARRRSKKTPSTAGASKITKGSGSSTITVTPCGHLFHTACIEQWFTNSNGRSCPSCRKNCPNTRMVRVFPVVLENTTAVGAAMAESVPSTSSQATRRNYPCVITIDEPNDDNNDDEVVPILSSNPGGYSHGVIAGHVQNPELEELKTAHQTLINDYNGVNTKFNEQVDELSLKEGIIKSYESSFEKLTQEVNKLKEELMATQHTLTSAHTNPPSASSGKSKGATSSTRKLAAATTTSAVATSTRKRAAPTTSAVATSTRKRAAAPTTSSATSSTRKRAAATTALAVSTSSTSATGPKRSRARTQSTKRATKTAPGSH